MIATQSERESLLVFLWELKTNQISNLPNPDFPWRLIFRVNDQLIKIEEMLQHSESECHTVNLESWRESLPLILILSTSQPPVRSLSSHFFAPATAFDLKSGRNGCSHTKLAKNFRQHRKESESPTAPKLIASIFSRFSLKIWEPGAKGYPQNRAIFPGQISLESVDLARQAYA